MTPASFNSPVLPASSILDQAASTHARASLCLVLLALAFFLPGFFSLQPMDRDEPRFAQATRQMLETGDFVAIRFQEEARNKKPVGIYWLQAASVSLGEKLGVSGARRQVWLYRLPSLLAAIASVLLAYWTALAFVGNGGAFLAAIMLGSTILIGVEARLAKTDATVLATVLAAMGAFARIYLGANVGSSWRLPAIFWTAIGVGLLVKGPITPMIPFFTALALLARDRSAPWFRALKPLPGVLWALLLILPWFVLIMIETKGAFLADSVGGDMLGKVQAGREGHGAPPLTYFAVFWATAWPMAPLAALAAPFVWQNRRDAKVAFLLAWLLPAWLLFEAVPTKLPHYVLPLYPAIALLIALAMENGGLGLASRWRGVILWLVPALAFGLLAGALGYGIWSGALPGLYYWVFALPALMLAVRFALREVEMSQRILSGTLAALCLYMAVYSGLLTAHFGREIAVSPRLAAVSSIPGCPETLLASAGYYEPSLVLLTRTNIAMVDGKRAAEFLKGGGCRLAFVDIRQEPGFRAEIGGELNISLRERIQGLNINTGRKLDIGVWTRAGETK